MHLTRQGPALHRFVAVPAPPRVVKAAPPPPPPSAPPLPVPDSSPSPGSAHRPPVGSKFCGMTVFKNFIKDHPGHIRLICPDDHLVTVELDAKDARCPQCAAAAGGPYSGYLRQNL